MHKRPLSLTPTLLPSTAAPLPRFVTSAPTQLHRPTQQAAAVPAPASPQSDLSVNLARPAQRTQAESKVFTLTLLQDLVRLHNTGLFCYYFMLEVLSALAFEGSADVSLKVAITLFHLGGKLLETRRPRLRELVAWTAFRISRDQVIACEMSILEGLGFEPPLPWDLTESQARDLCLAFEQQILADLN